MSKIKIYLCGKMTGLTYDEMNNWREEVTKIFNHRSDKIHVENPCDFYNFCIDKHTYTENEVKKFDLWLVKNCDIVLVNLEHPDTIGTAIELHEAYENWGKPVIGFGNPKTPIHPWMELSLTKKCNTMEDAVEHIFEFYVKNIT